jgi:hypothetical protein
MATLGVLITSSLRNYYQCCEAEKSPRETYKYAINDTMNKRKGSKDDIYSADMDKRCHVRTSFVSHPLIPHLLNFQYTYLGRHLHWRPQTQQRTAQLIPHHGRQASPLRHCHGPPSRKVQ